MSTLVKSVSITDMTSSPDIKIGNILGTADSARMEQEWEREKNAERTAEKTTEAADKNKGTLTIKRSEVKLLDDNGNIKPEFVDVYDGYYSSDSNSSSAADGISVNNVIDPVIPLADSLINTVMPTDVADSTDTPTPASDTTTVISSNVSPSDASDTSSSRTSTSTGISDIGSANRKDFNTQTRKSRAVQSTVSTIKGSGKTFSKAVLDVATSDIKKTDTYIGYQKTIKTVSPYAQSVGIMAMSTAVIPIYRHRIKKLVNSEEVQNALANVKQAQDLSAGKIKDPSSYRSNKKIKVKDFDRQYRNFSATQYGRTNRGHVLSGRGRCFQNLGIDRELHRRQKVHECENNDDSKLLKRKYINQKHIRGVKKETLNSMTNDELLLNKVSNKVARYNKLSKKLKFTKGAKGLVTSTISTCTKDITGGDHDFGQGYNFASKFKAPAKMGMKLAKPTMKVTDITVSGTVKVANKGIGKLAANIASKTGNATIYAIVTKTAGSSAALSSSLHGKTIAGAVKGKVVSTGKYVGESISKAAANGASAVGTALSKTKAVQSVKTAGTMASDAIKGFLAPVKKAGDKFVVSKFGRKLKNLLQGIGRFFKGFFKGAGAVVSSIFGIFSAVGTVLLGIVIAYFILLGGLMLLQGRTAGVAGRDSEATPDVAWVVEETTKALTSSTRSISRQIKFTNIIRSIGGQTFHSYCVDYGTATKYLIEDPVAKDDESYRICEYKVDTNGVEDNFREIICACNIIFQLSDDITATRTQHDLSSLIKKLYDNSHKITKSYTDYQTTQSVYDPHVACPNHYQGEQPYTATQLNVKVDIYRGKAFWLISEDISNPSVATNGELITRWCNEHCIPEDAPEDFSYDINDLYDMFVISYVQDDLFDPNDEDGNTYEGLKDYPIYSLTFEPSSIPSTTGPCDQCLTCCPPPPPVEIPDEEADVPAITTDTGKPVNPSKPFKPSNPSWHNDIYPVNFEY